MTGRELLSHDSAPRHIRTRRKLWLAANPEYYSQAGHALSLPLAYDRLIRAYQSPAERQAEGQRQGWARMLEGTLVRGEAKRGQAVKERSDAASEQRRNGMETSQDNNSIDSIPNQNDGAGRRKGLKALPEETEDMDKDGTAASPGNVSAEDVELLPANKWDKALGMIPTSELLETTPERLMDQSLANSTEETPNTQQIIEGIGKEQALGRWTELLKARFVAGADEDFEYNQADGNEAAEQEWQESRQQDSWFDDEVEAWSDDGTERGKKLEGETGVQDF